MRQSLLIVLTLALACRAPAARDAVWERHAADLAGRWTVRYDYAGGGTATGSIDLTINRTVEKGLAGIGIPTNYGTYDVPFRGLGGSPSGNRVPTLLTGVRSDSLFVVFESDREGFFMRMRAPLAVDSIVGAWVAGQSRGTIASGTFTMTRQ
jgi:hypothetical protein